MVVDNLCCFCESEGINARHLFFEYSFLSVAWVGSRLSNAINGLNSASAREKFGALLTSSNFDAVLFAVLCYFLWFYRNKALFERVNIDSVSIMTLENNSLVEFWEANRRLKHSHPSLLSRSWVSPPSFGFHIFFDGAIARSTPGAGCGVYVTNQNGVFVHGMSEFCKHPRSPP